MIFLETVHRKRRHILQRELHESNALLDAVINGTDYAIFVVDEEGVFKLYSRGAERMLGYVPSQIVGQNAMLFSQKVCVPEEIASRARRIQEQYGRPPVGIEVFKLPLRDDGPFGQEWINIRADGSRLTVAVMMWELKDADGEPQGSLAIVRDISRIKELEEVKHDFIATVSHELRTPLTSIQGALGLTTAGVAGPLPEKASELLAIAYRNTEHLVRLINDILDIEKIEAGKISVETKTLDASDALRGALESNRPYADRFGVHMVLKGATAGILASADPARLAQVLANLLSNASKYSPPGGEVWVATEVLPETVRFSVRDFGPGIPESFQPFVFEKFMQNRNEASRSGVDSTGLGLNITKRLVEAMQGTIGFETEAGKGTTFFFDLPRAV
jgi:PAS domain S-box-containing protein